MRTAIACGLVAGLAGCSHSPAEVTLPVALPCVRAADVPAPVPPAGPLPGDARQAADLLAAIVLQLRGNERVLRALILPCTAGAGIEGEWTGDDAAVSRGPSG